MSVAVNSFFRQLQGELSVLESKSLRRFLPEIVSRDGSRLGSARRKLVDFASNDYLGFATDFKPDQKIRQTLKRWGSGSGASRLLAGNLKIHEELESLIALFKSEESALLFGSGYLANIGTLSALASERDLILLDRMNHASLVDGARLSKAKLWVYPHLNLERLSELLTKAESYRRRFVVTDAYFSMEGNVAPLGELLAICQKYDAVLMIDEAHSSGVFGSKGRGLTERFRLQRKIPIVMGTLSKAIGSVGGFVAGEQTLKEYLVNKAKTFIYTTGPSPLASAVSVEALKRLLKDDKPRIQLWENVSFAREVLSRAGFDLGASEGPIIPIYLRDSEKAIFAKNYLMKKGFFVAAIRPPTVPKGKDLIRISITSRHSKEEIKALQHALCQMRDKIK